MYGFIQFSKFYIFYNISKNFYFFSIIRLYEFEMCPINAMYILQLDGMKRSIQIEMSGVNPLRLTDPSPSAVEILSQKLLIIPNANSSHAHHCHRYFRIIIYKNSRSKRCSF